MTIFAALASGACVLAAFTVLSLLFFRPASERHDAFAYDQAAGSRSGQSVASNYTPTQSRRAPPPASPREEIDVEPHDSPVPVETVALGRADADHSPSGGPQARGMTILQIGDSHTAADFLTGELRRRLQQRYGNGGPGYITAGKPHIGVRSSAVHVSASSGWTYHAIQKSDDAAEFWLSGFNAVATAPGEVLTFKSEGELVFDSIEIEALRRPGGGSIDIMLDGVVNGSYDLSAETSEPIVLRLSPGGPPADHIRQLEIKTTGEGSVSIASVAFYNKQSGLSYSSIGYPGATIDLLNKFDQALMADDLRRLDPQIIVLAFGTNEASKKNLDVARYERNYEKVIDKIKAALPNVEIVLVGPPDGAERGGKSESGKSGCDWHSLPKLEAVRNVARSIAARRGFAFWNWASIMPEKCGADRWVSATPPLMARDHVHFTVAGYNRSADEFLNTLIPVIEKVQAKTSLASRN